MARRSYLSYRLRQRLYQSKKYENEYKPVAQIETPDGSFVTLQNFVRAAGKADEELSKELNKICLAIECRLKETGLLGWVLFWRSFLSCLAAFWGEEVKHADYSDIDNHGDP